MQDKRIKKIGNYYYDIDQQLLAMSKFAKVYEGYEVKNKEKVAIKFIEKHTIVKYYKPVESFKQEIEILTRIKGEHILSPKGIVNTYSGNIYIVTNFCNGGSIEKMLMEKEEKEEKFIEQKALNILKQVSETFQNLKDENGIQIMHRNLKPANILFHDEVIKIADFGFTKFIKDTDDYIYMSPQILNDEDYTHKCDIWSMGIILFEMLTGIRPWGKSVTKYTWWNKTKQDPSIQYPKSQDISEECKDLLEKMLKINEAERIDWKGILKHPAIHDNNKVTEEKCNLRDIKMNSSKSTGKIDKTADKSLNNITKLNKSDSSTSLSTPPNKRIYAKRYGISISEQDLIEFSNGSPEIGKILNFYLLYLEEKFSKGLGLDKTFSFKAIQSNIYELLSNQEGSLNLNEYFKDHKKPIIEQFEQIVFLVNFSQTNRWYLVVYSKSSKCLSIMTPEKAKVQSSSTIKVILNIEEKDKILSAIYKLFDDDFFIKEKGHLPSEAIKKKYITDIPGFENREDYGVHVLKMMQRVFYNEKFVDLPVNKFKQKFIDFITYFGEQNKEALRFDHFL